MNGFRNRDIRDLLFPAPTTAADDEATSIQQRGQSSQVTRLLRLFRAHGLIQKIPHTHRYQLTAINSPPTVAEFFQPSPQREPRVHKHLTKSLPKIFSP